MPLTIISTFAVAQDCVDYSGEWAGECKAANQKANVTVVVKQDKCDTISLGTKAAEGKKFTFGKKESIDRKVPADAAKGTPEITVKGDLELNWSKTANANDKQNEFKLTSNATQTYDDANGQEVEIKSESEATWKMDEANKKVTLLQKATASAQGKTQTQEVSCELSGK